MDENKLFEQEPRSGGFFRTQGFYIMLALCLLIVGTAVALTALPGGEAAPSPTNPAVQSNQSDDETLFGRRTPAPTLRPTVQPSASPAPTAAPTAAPQSTSTGARPARKGSAPAAGSIQWGYAMEQLLYSRTLDQWTTHAGVDIAAAEGTEVCAVLPGTVASVYEDDALVAYLLMVRPVGCEVSQLDYFAVLPQYRAGGIGAALLAALPDHEKGAQAILIEAECPEKAEDEAMAVRRLGFYARCGAKDTGWTEHLFDAWFRVLVLPCCGGKVRSPEEAVRQLADCYRRTMGEPQWRRNVTFYRPDGVEVQF